MKVNLICITEHKDSYRCLLLYKGRGTIPPFCYEDNGLRKVHLKEGQGIFFRGTTEYFLREMKIRFAI